MNGSLAYRKNEAAILAGDVPAKYTRLLPYITGDRILEIGSAEGVLACLLARAGKEVTALERNTERHQSAIRLYDEWAGRSGFPPPDFENGDITERFDLLEGADTFVAVRVIYYLRDRIDEVFAQVAMHVPNVVLCGNRGRTANYHNGTPDEPLGEYNFYASAEGMTALLCRHGYEIAAEVREGDAIVVGRKNG